MKKNISVVIVHHNTIVMLQQCLLRLQSHQFHLDLIVVDNGSSVSLEKVRRAFPQVKWILNDRNYGFSFANNQGFLQSEGLWTLFLNPDVLMSAQEVYELFHWAEKVGADAVSPDLGSDDYKKPLPSLRSLFTEFTPLHRFSSLQTFEQKTLVGGCLLIRSKVLQALGGWDERFFLWFEDSDLTIRLLLNGYCVAFSPQKVSHKGGASVKKLTTALQRSLFFHSLSIYVKKHFDVYQQKMIWFAILRRFSDGNVYPKLNSGSTWVVPNMKLEILNDFLHTNKQFFRRSDLVIVSSKLNEKNVWSYRKRYPLVRFIPIESNNGFAHTVNIGFRVATTPFIGTVNDDVILNKTSLPTLERSMPYHFGSINPVIVDTNHRIESAGIEIQKKGKARTLTTLPKKALSVVQATNGACVLYNAAALDIVGLFDEKFGSYLEDIDLSLRLSQNGFPNYIVKNAIVIHTKHATSKGFWRFKAFLDMKNWWLVILKNWSVADFLFYSPLILIERARNLSGFIKSGSSAKE